MKNQTEHIIGDLAGKEQFSRYIDLDMLDRIHLKIKVIEKDGQVIKIVDSDDNPFDGKIEAEGLFVDTLMMDGLTEFFREAQIRFVGNPWTVSDQEDFPGDISIDCEDLNRALKNKKISIVSEEDGSTYYSFEGLENYVDTFSNNHSMDEKYNEADNNEDTTED